MLDYILNIEKFQTIQDDIAKATDMAVITIDIKGNPVTKHSGCSSFCQKVRSNRELNKLCEKCDSRGGLEAARDQDAFIYTCHLGIVDIAIPIIVDDQYLGAIMAGQVRVQESDKDTFEQIVSRKYQKDIVNFPELKDEYNKLPIMTIEKIEAVSHMINHLVNYIVEEALIKTTHIHEDHKKTLLKPALKYIDEHYKEKIYMDKMAYLCNISPGYFSKLFKRETGESFSTYVNIIKLSRAKEMLTNSDDPIANIALDLGFEDCGYFIKVFKKHMNETPATYRNKMHS